VDLLDALLLAACFAVIEIPVSNFQIPHFEVTIESLIHVLIRNDPRKENRKFYPLLILKTHSIFLHSRLVGSPTRRWEKRKEREWVGAGGCGGETEG